MSSANSFFQHFQTDYLAIELLSHSNGKKMGLMISYEVYES